jgi:hypothetical protein
LIAANNQVTLLGHAVNGAYVAHGDRIVTQRSTALHLYDCLVIADFQSCQIESYGLSGIMDSDIHDTPRERVSNKDGSLRRSMPIQLQPAQVEDKPVVYHLLQLYLHDCSEFNRKNIDEHGLFDYPYLDYY